MTRRFTIFIYMLLCVCTPPLSAQNYTQTLRGQVIEKQLQKPIPGATIRIEGSTMGTVSDLQGKFTIPNVPIGRITVMVSAIGYKESVLSNLLLQSGKELVINIPMDEKLVEGKTILIKAQGRKNKPLNELSAVSARAFTVEETQKYAAAVNDPGRMATNFAGVVSADDGNNNIVIRGNSPSGLLWRMEGIDVPNPNHFANSGSSGGGVSILSAQLLSNSDFVTGAFAAEYGNALSGVFDLNLRKGNNQQREYTVQAGVLGLNVAAEGPFKKNSDASYLINYRYSTLNILEKIGLKIMGEGTSTNFQDLSYNIVLPTKKWGTFSLFSFGGLSTQSFTGVKDSSKWTSMFDRYGNNFKSNTGVWAMTHRIHIHENTLLKTAVAYSVYENKFIQNYIQDDYTFKNMFNESYLTKKITLSTTLNHRFSSHTLLRTGIILNHYDFNFSQTTRERTQDPLKQLLGVHEQTQSGQAFAQLQYKWNDKWNLSGGLHALYLALNQRYSIEPRASLTYTTNPKNIFALGFGKHSQLQGFGTYFTEINSPTSTLRPNESLDFSKALHLVASYQYQFNKVLRLKTELYYQHLYLLPVSQHSTSTFCTVNTQDDYIREALQNKGKGRNYGLELTLEKSLSHQFYYMVTSSIYTSKYTPANGIEYNTRYNGGFVANIVAGKDFASSNKRRTVGVNARTIYAGGYRSTPIDLEQSKVQEKTVYLDALTNTEQVPNYFRCDLRFSITWNRKRANSTLSLDLQNASNRKNVYGRYYDAQVGQIKTYYQTPLIPILNYKLEF